MIKNGKTVSWESQSAGHYTIKTGEVLCFITGGVSVEKIYPAIKDIPISQRKFQNTSVNDRYLIRVDRTGSKGQKLVSHYYAPNASVIERGLHNQIKK